MATRDRTAVYVRMPPALRKALRRLSYLTETPINQIVVLTLAYNLGDHPIGYSGRPDVDFEIIRAHTDNEISMLLDEAKKAILEEGQDVVDRYSETHKVEDQNLAGQNEDKKPSD